jgi:hypothetical protein
MHALRPDPHTLLSVVAPTEGGRQAGRDDVAHQDLVDGGWIGETGAFDGCPDDHRAEARG